MVLRYQLILFLGMSKKCLFYGWNRVCEIPTRLWRVPIKALIEDHWSAELLCYLNHIETINFKAYSSILSVADAKLFKGDNVYKRPITQALSNTGNQRGDGLIMQSATLK